MWHRALDKHRIVRNLQSSKWLKRGYQQMVQMVRVQRTFEMSIDGQSCGISHQCYFDIDMNDLSGANSPELEPEVVYLPAFRKHAAVH